MIKNFNIKLLFIVMSVALLIVIAVQWFWIANALEVRQQQFSDNVYKVLKEVTNRVEQINYAKYISNVGDRLESAGIVDNDKKYGPYSESLIDSLMYGSGYYKFQDDGSYMPRNRRMKSNYTPYGEYYSLFGKSGKVKTTEMMFSRLVESAMKKFDITKSGSPKQFEKSKKSLESFIIQIFQQSDVSKLSTEARLKDIDMYGIIRTYLGFNGINLDFEVELAGEHKTDSLKRSKEKVDYFIVNPFPNDWRKKNKKLVVHFKDSRGYLYDSISWLLFASGFCISILMFVFGYTIFVIIRQKKLSEVKNDFINNMTHEFKTPIATISLATSAIKNEKVLYNPEQILKFNSMVKKENERMHKHVEKILHQARLDRKEIELNEEEFHVNDLLEETCNHFSLQCKEKGVELTCDKGAIEDIIIGDKTHILNCIINLVDNSIKYSKENPKILVYSKNVSKGVLIGVQDNGIGLSREAQKMVFTRFYRVTHGNLHNVKGFGLGLSYLKSIVDAHKGTINLKSKLNKGTTIELVFPKK